MASSSTDSKTHSNSIQYEGFDGNDENVLKKHVTFFDRNMDGVIYPWETFQGFRAIGCGIFLSSFASIFINAGLSGKTRPGKFPNLLFPIEIRNIQKAKHGSDSGVYDTEGRFVPSKFEEIFSKHARKKCKCLNIRRIIRNAEGKQGSKGLWRMDWKLSRVEDLVYPLQGQKWFTSERHNPSRL
ncbi:caleosin-related family protein [Actinidia rufa]|uniref:Caleosin-related family protein n=1 Tax=Actinidia rufa TaxID=165716 RepID=A0A7J0DR01_9ERIC|nr:caleosin-related family protein [Actinidia rufa]